MKIRDKGVPLIQHIALEVIFLESCHLDDSSDKDLFPTSSCLPGVLKLRSSHHQEDSRDSVLKTISQ